jgi:hypothetical protein
MYLLKEKGILLDFKGKEARKPDKTMKPSTPRFADAAHLRKVFLLTIYMVFLNFTSRYI